MAAYTNVRHAGRLIPIGIHALSLYLHETTISENSKQYLLIVREEPSGKALVELRLNECPAFPLMAMAYTLQRSESDEIVRNIAKILPALEEIAEELTAEQESG